MPITLNDFKEGGSLRNFVTQVGLLGKIDKEGVNQTELLNTLINSVTMVGAYTDSNSDGAITSADSVSEKFSNKEDDENTEDNKNENKTPDDGNTVVNNSENENTAVDNNDSGSTVSGNTNEGGNNGGNENLVSGENNGVSNTNEQEGEQESTDEQDNNTQEEVDSPSVDPTNTTPPTDQTDSEQE